MRWVWYFVGFILEWSHIVSLSSAKIIWLRGEGWNVWVFVWLVSKFCLIFWYFFGVLVAIGLAWHLASKVEGAVSVLMQIAIQIKNIQSESEKVNRKLSEIEILIPDDKQNDYEKSEWWRSKGNYYRWSIWRTIKIGNYDGAKYWNLSVYDRLYSWAPVVGSLYHNLPTKSSALNKQE